MIQHKTVLEVADNSGAHQMYVTHIFGGSTRKFGYIGDIVKAVVKSADPTAMVKEGEQVLAVVVRCHKETRRIDGSYIRFDDNAGVLIDTAVDKNPRGTRIFGPIARELKEKGFNKIISMAGEVL
jgi:large subunit ribosomal protein L14